MKVSKSLAKQQVEVYSQLLQERGVISNIEQEEFQKEIHYMFDIYEKMDFPYPVQCIGVQELALVLTCMWTAYSKSQEELGLWVEDDYSIY